MMRALLLVLALVPWAAGCHQRCEEGFISQGGCVNFDLDAGEEPEADAGPPEDVGPGPSDTGPFDNGTQDGGRDGGAVDLGFTDGGPLPSGGYLLRGQAVLPMDGQGPYTPGEVWIDGARVGCVGPVGACTAMAGTVPVIETEGVVLPGLVDAHNHVAYNWLPEWIPGRLYADSGQWRAAAQYEAFVQAYTDNKGVAESFCAMVQWGEIRALVNGVTTIFGTPQPRTCYRWLVRNAELTSGYNGFASDRVRSNTLGIDQVSPTEAADLIADMESGDVAAYMVHLAEGLSTRAHDEYVELTNLMLLRPQTVIIHGTALTATDFAMVGQAGSKLIWSPSSNMALYGDTTNVQAAKQAGVSISLAPDWTPSGEDDSLGEVRFAKALVEGRWPGLFSDQEYVEMVTSEPAAAMGLAGDVGRLAVGQFADVLVLDAPGGDPYATVVGSGANNIRLVILNGVPSYGDSALMAQVPGRPAACFAFDACGAARQACWGDTPAGAVSPESVASVIQSFYPSGPSALFDCN
jgi:5-methylthioadenosine/S-adenosylhomocysteine deaminase